MPESVHNQPRERPSVPPDRTPARVFLRPIGSPLPLGFLGLAVATLALAGQDLGWVPSAESHQVAVVMIAFAFPVQIVASVFGFLGRDTVAGSGIGVQAATWLTTGIVILTLPPGGRSQTLGLFLFVAAAALAPAVATASMGKVLAAVVMSGTMLRWVLTGLYERFGTEAWKHATGWEGVALCAVALYAALAFEVEDAQRRTILPTLRHGQGRRAIAGGIRDQVRMVEDEAGVREQL
ncbi:MAG TPA: hypothetical protein VFP54_07695 [Acidimicrobiales bacterium]|nr:hypothetical protein [Acidimicrobiales bacterium]